jgi:hypothetical protein
MPPPVVAGVVTIRFAVSIISIDKWGGAFFPCVDADSMDESSPSLSIFMILVAIVDAPGGGRY